MRMLLIFSSIVLLSISFVFILYEENSMIDSAVSSVSFSSQHSPKKTSSTNNNQKNVEKNIPTTISFEKKQVESSIFEVGVDEVGRMQTLPDAQSITWYGKGAIPGDNGNGILAGHRDWKGDIGFFQYLEEIQLQEPVRITYKDGTTKTFHVAQKEEFYEEEVPPYVMSQEGEKRITLITCTGTFDKEKRSYVKRLIVTLK